MTKPILPWTRSIEYEANLTEDEIAIRNAVVKEYLFDYSWVNACKRVGMNSAMAIDYAKRFQDDGYCQKRIKELQEQKATSSNMTRKQEEELERQRIIEGLRFESQNTGPGSSQSARVAAYKQLCAIYGFEAPKQQKVEVGVSSGVMLVPMVGSMDDWEKAANASQTKLQEDTINGLNESGTVH